MHTFTFEKMVARTQCNETRYSDRTVVHCKQADDVTRQYTCNMLQRRVITTTVAIDPSAGEITLPRKDSGTANIRLGTKMRISVEVAWIFRCMVISAKVSVAWIFRCMVMT
jgi:hypothetical protein